MDSLVFISGLIFAFFPPFKIYVMTMFSFQCQELREEKDKIRAYKTSIYLLWDIISGIKKKEKLSFHPVREQDPDKEKVAALSTPTLPSPFTVLPMAETLLLPPQSLLLPIFSTSPETVAPLAHVSALKGSCLILWNLTPQRHDTASLVQTLFYFKKNCGTREIAQ